MYSSLYQNYMSVLLPLIYRNACDIRHPIYIYVKYQASNELVIKF